MSCRWPFLVPFLCISAGMSISLFSGYYCDAATIIAAFSLLIITCFLRYSLPFSISIILFFFFWGLYALHPWLAPEISIDSVQSKASVTPVTIEGIISSRPSVSPEGSRITLRVEGISTGKHFASASGSLLLYVGEGDVSYFRGDRIRFTSAISLPHRFGLPGEFDYPRYLSFQGIYATTRVRSQNEIVLIRAAAEETLQRSIDVKARLLGDAIRRTIPDERISSILTALLVGDQRRIPSDLSDAYTKAGVNHILSISGFHVGIIATFITILVIWLLTRFEYFAIHWNVQRIALMIAVPVMIAYLFLTGNAPATARSVVMLVVLALALFSERESDSINTLLFAAFVLVAINPPALFDVSFQLSFLSLWGILITVPIIVKYTGRVKSHWLRSMIQFVAASVAASCVTLLPVLFVFKVASFNGILTNFIIVPLLGYGAVLAGFTALPLVLFLPSYANLLLWPAASMVKLSNIFISWCDSLPVISYFSITRLDIIFFLLLMTVITFVNGRYLRRAFILLIPSSAIAVHILTAMDSDGKLHITMLSVGQAECILLRLPDGSTMLVDGGGYLHDTGHDFGQRLLAPALGALLVKKIDRVISTHDHPDHSGGFPFVIRNFPVGEFWSSTDLSDEIQRVLNIRKVTQRILASGDVLVLPGPVTISVLSPQRSAQASKERNDKSNLNEQSLVFHLTYKSFSMLFCADAGFEAEQRMLTGHHDLKSTVLKVGHHGSRFSTSEEFLERVGPSLALISVGAGNRFGLPSPDTLDLLKLKKVPIYRTDRDGTIELVTDGASWSVSTPYKPE